MKTILHSAASAAITCCLMAGTSQAQFVPPDGKPTPSIAIGPVTDSSICVEECLIDGDTFCRFAENEGEGVCCDAGDIGCITDEKNGLCSNVFKKTKGYQVFACPFETDACGAETNYILSTDGSFTAIQSRSSFKKNKVCYYQIATPPQAKEGEFLHLKIEALSNVEAFISIGNQMSEDDTIQCGGIVSGDMIVARAPHKFFISFKATTTDNAKFYLNAHYSRTMTDQNVLNYARCNDNGKSLIGAKEANKDPAEDKEFAGKTGLPTMIPITNFAQRSSMNDAHLSATMLQEVFFTNKRNTNLTFNSFMITIAILLMIVSGLVMYQFYSSKKQGAQYMEQQAQLRQVRQQNHARQEALQEEQEDESSLDEESEGEQQAVRHQIDRIAYINEMMARRNAPSRNGQDGGDSRLEVEDLSGGDSNLPEGRASVGALVGPGAEEQKNDRNGRSRRRNRRPAGEARRNQVENAVPQQASVNVANASSQVGVNRRAIAPAPETGVSGEMEHIDLRDEEAPVSRNAPRQGFQVGNLTSAANPRNNGGAASSHASRVTVLNRERQSEPQVNVEGLASNNQPSQQPFRGEENKSEPSGAAPGNRQPSSLNRRETQNRNHRSKRRRSRRDGQ